MFRALGSLLIALSFLPLSLAASEIPVSPAAIGPAPGFQTSPSLATDGAGFLGVWADDREGLGPVIYGARFGSNGQLLDPSGIRLGSSGAASVAYGDGRYLVVTSFLDTFSVAPDGTFEPGPRLGNQINTPQVIFGGRDFLVCWTEGLSLRAVFVNGDGAPSGAAFPFGVAGSDVATLQSVAFNGSHFIVLYTTGIQLRAAVLDSSGALMSDQALDQQQSPFGSGTAAVASNGGTFVAAWQVNGREIRAVQFDDRGVLKNAISTVRFPPADESINGIKLVPRDSGYVLFDTEGPTSFGAPHRVMALPVTTPAGLFAFGASRVVLSDPQLWANVPAAASNSSTTITLSQLWDPNRPAIESELFAVQTDALGQPTSGATRQAALLVTRAAAAQHDPSLASNDAGLLVAWQESRGEANGAAQIAATFFDRSGSQPVTNLVAPSSSAQELPSAAGVGASFFVAWREPYGALRARLLVHGVAAGPVLPIAAADTQPSAPVVRSDGSQFVVAWIAGAKLYSARFTPEGTPAEASAPVTINHAFQPIPPALACARGECLAAWNDDIVTYGCPNIACSSVESKIIAVRFGPQGERLDPQPIAVASLGPNAPRSLTAAADGQFGYAVAWDQIRSSNHVSLYAIASTGASRALAADVPGESPSLTWDGTSWIIAHSLQLSNGEHDTLAERIPAAGGTPSTFILSATPQDEHAPVALATGDTVVYAYERTTRNEPPAGVNRIYLGEGNAVPRRRIAR